MKESMSGQSAARTLLCPRCRAAHMVEVTNIAPLLHEPGLIAYECPQCGHLASFSRPLSPDTLNPRTATYVLKACCTAASAPKNRLSSGALIHRAGCERNECRPSSAPHRDDTERSAVRALHCKHPDRGCQLAQHNFPVSHSSTLRERRQRMTP